MTVRATEQQSQPSARVEEEDAFLLAAVREAVARTSIRAVARASGMSHGAIYNFVNSRTRRVYGKTIGKLRSWYLRQWASSGDSLTPEVAAYLVEQVLAAVQPGERVAAALELVQGLERIYDGHTTPRPAWLGAVREEYRSRSTLPDGSQEGSVFLSAASPPERR